MAPHTLTHGLCPGAGYGKVTYSNTCNVLSTLLSSWSPRGAQFPSSPAVHGGKMTVASHPALHLGSDLEHDPG